MGVKEKGCLNRPEISEYCFNVTLLICYGGSQPLTRSRPMRLLSTVYHNAKNYTYNNEDTLIDTEFDHEFFCQKLWQIWPSIKVEQPLYPIRGQVKEAGPFDFDPDSPSSRPASNSTLHPTSFVCFYLIRCQLTVAATSDFSTCVIETWCNHCLYPTMHHDVPRYIARIYIFMKMSIL